MGRLVRLGKPNAAILSYKGLAQMCVQGATNKGNV